MAIQIANPTVVDKIERFAALSGLSKRGFITECQRLFPLNPGRACMLVFDNSK